LTGEVRWGRPLPGIALPLPLVQGKMYEMFYAAQPAAGGFIPEIQGRPLKEKR